MEIENKTDTCRICGNLDWYDRVLTVGVLNFRGDFYEKQTSFENNNGYMIARVLVCGTCGYIYGTPSIKNLERER